MASETSKGNLKAQRMGIFWGRQFGSEVTPLQNAFDISMGIFLPVLCFIYDPGILSGSDLPGLVPELLSSQRLFIYFMSGLAILTLMVWLLARQRIKSWSGSVGGILLAGALCSFIIGAIILPLTIIGLMMVIGVLGFVPFLTSFVYLRNGIRALRRGETYSGRTLLVGTAVLSSAFLIVAPGVAQWRINNAVSQSVQALIRGEASSTEAAVQKLKALRWFTDLDQLALAYARETDSARKTRLAVAYKEITGKEIEDRLAILFD